MSRSLDTKVNWTATGRVWVAESQPFEVSDGAHFGIAKPGVTKTDGVARAAHEKIASDLAYLLGLPVPPAVLWRRVPCPAGAHPCCSISAMAFAQPLDLGPSRHLIVGPLRDDARRISSGIAPFDTWIGARDRHHGNAIIDADTSSGLKMAFIDHSHSLSHTWKRQPNHFPFIHQFAASFGGALRNIVEEVINLILGLPAEAIISTVQRIPDDFMGPADRQLVAEQLLQRRGKLRSVCGLR
jgi:hypothetical protein